MNYFNTLCWTIHMKFFGKSFEIDSQVQQFQVVKWFNVKQYYLDPGEVMIIGFKVK